MLLLQPVVVAVLLATPPLHLQSCTMFLGYCHDTSVCMCQRPLAGVLSTMKQYPLSYALGVLFVGFVVPQFLAFGLVGVERAFLAFLLELEQLLVAAFLTGAKWVTLAAVLCGGVALLWYETQKKKF